MRRLVIPALIVVMLTALTACDPGADITWVNDTNRTVVVYLDDNFDDTGDQIEPHSSRTLGTIKAVWNDIIVLRDEEGTVLFRQELTWDELKAQGFRFEITEEMIAPTPTPAP